MIVEEIWRYPVKSVGGEMVDATDMSETGIRGDRRWSIIDVESSRVLAADRVPELLMAEARLVEDAPVIVLPDGSETSDDDRLSEWLDRQVALVEASSTGDESVTWDGPAGAWHDRAGARLTLVSRDSIGDWDRRRFRSNVLLSGGGEDELVSRRVELGSAELAIEMEVERCVIVTRPQPGLERDLDVLKTINRHRGRTLAVGATVARAGSFAVGNELIARTARGEVGRR